MLFEYAIVKLDENQQETEIITEPTPFLAVDGRQAELEAARKVPSDYDLSEVQIYVAPFGQRVG